MSSLRRCDVQPGDIATWVGISRRDAERRIRLAEEQDVADDPPLIAVHAGDERADARRECAREQDGEPSHNGESSATIRSTYKKMRWGMAKM